MKIQSSRLLITTLILSLFLSIGVPSTDAFAENRAGSRLYYPGLDTAKKPPSSTNISNIFLPLINKVFPLPVQQGRISAGDRHTCALNKAGGVLCWGSNGYNQLGDGSNTDKALPVYVSGLTGGAVSVTAGRFHTCALTENGGVKCWGLNEDGQLGDGTTFDRNVPVDVFGLTSGVIEIAAGEYHTCALTEGRGVKCWGWNGYGQLGDDSNTTRLTPVDVYGLTTGVTAIATGGGNFGLVTGHTCALTENGVVKCWGNNEYGQLGDGTSNNRKIPVTASGMTSGAKAITAGGAFTCALTDYDGARCWGLNSNGQLGDGTTLTRYTPADVSSLNSESKVVEAGLYHTCAIVGNRSVKCWGNNDNGQLGIGTINTQLTPVDVSGLSSDVTAIAAGGSHTCVLMTSGNAKCWGDNYNGQIGDGTFLDRYTPVDVYLPEPLGPPVRAKTVVAGGVHTCALTELGGVKCWGGNGEGQLGDGTTSYQYTPVTVSGMNSNVIDIAAGDAHTCVLTSEGAVMCWGDNEDGQLGDGTGINQLTPVSVSGLNSGIKAISAGGNHTCAMTDSGGVKCWGLNSNGQLGNGMTISQLTPVDVSGLHSGVTAVVAGGGHTCALKEAGGLMCWGLSYSGQLGTGTLDEHITPVNVSGMTSDVIAFTAGYQHTCAIVSSGSVKCWGWNQEGQIGDGTTINRLSPVNVAGLNGGFTGLATGLAHSCARSELGIIKCWGINLSGQLGDGTDYRRLTPVDVVELENFTSTIDAGNGHTCAVTTNGGVKCWGRNSEGQLGDSTTNDRLTPVDVLGFGDG